MTEITTEDKGTAQAVTNKNKKNKSKGKQLIAELADAKLFRKIIDSLSLLEEGNFIVSERGIELRAMDPSRVAMVDLALNPELFERFYEGEANLRLGLKLDDLSEILARAKTGDALRLLLEDSTKLQLVFIGKNTREFGINLLDLGENQYPLPNIESKATIKCVSDFFYEAIKDAEICGDHLRIKAELDKLTLSASSETKDVEITAEKDSDDIAEWAVKEEATSNYSLSYLIEMIKPRSYSQLMSFSFAGALPIKIAFQIPGGGEIKFFTAPRINP